MTDLERITHWQNVSFVLLERALKAEASRRDGCVMPLKDRQKADLEVVEHILQMIYDHPESDPVGLLEAYAKALKEAQ